MDFLRGLIGRHDTQSMLTPTASQWLSDLPHQPLYLSLLCIGCVFTAVVITLGAVHLLYVLLYISNEQIQTDLYWLVFLPPIVASCGCVGMAIPRAALFLYSIALAYFMLCLFVTVTLMTTLHGSRQAMCEKLRARQLHFSFRVMPIGCCLCCLPNKVEPSERNFRRIEWLVFQSPLVRISLEVLNIVVFFELTNRNSM